MRAGLDFYTLDILTMFINAHRDEFHAYAQEFDEYTRKETDGMVDAITCCLPMMYEQPVEPKTRPERTPEEDAEWVAEKRAEYEADRICGHHWGNC